MPFKKGKSGNPTGRRRGASNKSTADIKALAQKHGATAIAKLVTLMQSEDERTRIAAIKELLDRGYGKAAQPLSGEGGEGPAVVRIERVIVDAED